jgi:hypothetical protein
MTIAESQLDIWAKQGSVTQLRNTYATIKGVLEAKNAPYADKSFSTFLQGSYGRDTNVYADSDVDVVIRLDSIYYTDLPELSENNRVAYQCVTADATYTLGDFKNNVAQYLTAKYGSAVTQGKNAISIKGNNIRRDADVLVCAEFRRYCDCTSLSSQSYAKGICFFLPDGTRIENFPKQHFDNCISKHKATKQWFKPMVRVLKNVRNRMIENRLIEEGLAPSYYLESLLYNVPNDKFGKSYVSSFYNCISWILQADHSKFLCANELFYLVRGGSAVTWRDASCARFLNALIDFWEHW